jgi:hypothetical protein
MSGVPVGEGFWIVRQRAVGIKSFQPGRVMPEYGGGFMRTGPPKSARRANHFGLAESLVNPRNDKYSALQK